MQAITARTALYRGLRSRAPLDIIVAKEVLCHYPAHLVNTSRARKPTIPHNVSAALLDSTATTPECQPPGPYAVADITAHLDKTLSIRLCTSAQRDITVRKATPYPGDVTTEHTKTISDKHLVRCALLVISVTILLRLWILLLGGLVRLALTVQLAQGSKMNLAVYRVLGPIEQVLASQVIVILVRQGEEWVVLPLFCPSFLYDDASADFSSQ